MRHGRNARAADAAVCTRWDAEHQHRPAYLDYVGQPMFQRDQSNRRLQWKLQFRVQLFPSARNASRFNSVHTPPADPPELCRSATNYTVTFSGNGNVPLIQTVQMPLLWDFDITLPVPDAA